MPEFALLKLSKSQLKFFGNLIFNSVKVVQGA